MAFKSFTDSLHKVTEKIEDYSISTAEYYKLRLFKSSMKGAVSLVNLLVYGSLFLFVMLFLSIGAAFWLGTFFEHSYVGFLLVGVFYGIILIFMFIYGRKMIERKMLYKFSGLLYDEDDLAPKEVAENEVKEYEKTLDNEVLQNVNNSNV
ncbi:phage holin family protein [Aequorivita sp. Q41]|uniref:phage holin family protein n=1 Tax=Aequorivita sp. Q41 TaxID=3153300 RepID=UPI003242FDAF